MKKKQKKNSHDKKNFIRFFVLKKMFPLEISKIIGKASDNGRCGMNSIIHISES